MAQSNEIIEDLRIPGNTSELSPVVDERLTTVHRAFLAVCGLPQFDRQVVPSHGFDLTSRARNIESAIQQVSEAYDNAA